MITVAGRCRLCGNDELTNVLDLGMMPPCERFLAAHQLSEPEPRIPLCLQVCPVCLLVQIPALITPEETFTEYAYFSSYSPSWVSHAGRFVDAAVRDLGLDGRSFVVEAASNDGYLLKHVIQQGIPCLGIEPSHNISVAARGNGVPTVTEFLNPATGERIRKQYGPANLVVANNVYAHVPDIAGFTQGLRALVADDGWVSIEVQHVLNLVRQCQFDTIYHEHFQYYTVKSARRALATGGLELVDVEMLPTHGGSLRLWARPAEAMTAVSPRVYSALSVERAAGLHTAAGYAGLGDAATRIRQDLVAFLLAAASSHRRVVGYGAPGKASTLLNYCGIGPGLLEYTVDRNPYKHGLFTPGTRVPIHPVERIAEDRPDFVLVLPWNLRPELMRQLRYIARWGGRLIFAIPRLDIVACPDVESVG